MKRETIVHAQCRDMNDRLEALIRLHNAGWRHVTTVEGNEPSTHEWWKWFGLECCKKCGIVRRRDDANGPCKGHVKVGPRS